MVNIYISAVSETKTDHFQILPDFSKAQTKTDLWVNQTTIIVIC